MRRFFLCCISVLLINGLKAQLTKGHWLLGGNASFSSVKYSTDVAASYTHINLQLSPAVGFFFIDKLAAGLRPSYSYTRTTPGTSNQGRNELSLGPFVRYYFLNLENRANILAEVGYRYVITKLSDNPRSTSHGVSIAAGPVVYLNSSVGVEFLIGYSSLNYSGDANDRNYSIQVGLGLQVHLERDN